MPTIATRNRSQRLRRRAEFQRVYRQGRRLSGRIVNVFVLGNDGLGVRYGITVTRRSGPAVRRNRLRRQARAIMRESRTVERRADLDLVIHFRPGKAEFSFQELEKEMTGLLRRALRRQGENR